MVAASPQGKLTQWPGDASSLQNTAVRKHGPQEYKITLQICRGRHWNLQWVTNLLFTPHMHPLPVKLGCKFEYKRPVILSHFSCVACNIIRPYIFCLEDTYSSIWLLEYQQSCSQINFYNKLMHTHTKKPDAYIISILLPDLLLIRTQQLTPLHNVKFLKP